MNNDIELGIMDILEAIASHSTLAVAWCAAQCARMLEDLFMGPELEQLRALIDHIEQFARGVESSLLTNADLDPMTLQLCTAVNRAIALNNELAWWRVIDLVLTRVAKETNPGDPESVEPALIQQMRYHLLDIDLVELHESWTTVGWLIEQRSVPL